MSAHTPGPWRIDAGRHGTHIRSGKPTDPLGGNLVAQVFDAGNARLIAASPDMLEALQVLIDMDVAYRRGYKVEAAVERASAAIAKATGGAA